METYTFPDVPDVLQIPDFWGIREFQAIQGCQVAQYLLESKIT